MDAIRKQHLYRLDNNQCGHDQAWRSRRRTNTPLGTTGSGTVISATGAALDLNGFTLSTTEALTLNGTGVSSGGALTNSSATAVNYNAPLHLEVPAALEQRVT